MILAATGPGVLLALAALCYALYYRAFELVLLAACIDAYFGYGHLPYYLLVTTVAIFLIELGKPHVRLRASTV